MPDYISYDDLWDLCMEYLCYFEDEPHTRQGLERALKEMGRDYDFLNELAADTWQAMNPGAKGGFPLSKEKFVERAIQLSRNEQREKGTVVDNLNYINRPLFKAGEVTFSPIQKSLIEALKPLANLWDDSMDSRVGGDAAKVFAFGENSITVGDIKRAHSIVFGHAP